MSCDRASEEKGNHDVENQKDVTKNAGGNPLDNVTFTQEKVTNKENEKEENIEEEKQICDVL